MFKEIAGQSAVDQLVSDIQREKMPPSILFSGPVFSGKGTASLELARILSCEKSGEEECVCPSCSRHRILAHPDTLCLGARNFSAEIAAGADAFVKNPEKETVFVRAIKKLLARFAPILWEDEPKFSKLAPLIVGLEEAVDEIPLLKNSADQGKKQRAGIVKDAVKLESEGISDMIPINQIRRASAWAHLTASGRRKTLIIENADRMQEGARNSLLKILEEPPESLVIVLTSAHEQALLQTILSRVRPYRFVKRPPEIEAEIIKAVFEGESRDIGAYFDSFLPVSSDSLRPLAAFFAASLAMITVLRLKRPASALPEELVALGKRTTLIAEAKGLGRPIKNTRNLIEKILADAENFEIRGLFPCFLRNLLALVNESLAQTASFSPAYLDIWRRRVNEAGIASISYNLKPASALNALISEISGDLLDLFS
jgi:DNA polymerase-3 subunit gamma/tau